jgi:small-conductance mechanosensitive channel
MTFDHVPVYDEQKEAFMIINILATILSSPPLQDSNPPGASESLVYFVAILGLILSLTLIFIINKVFATFYKSMENWCYSRLQVVRVFTLELVFPQRLIQVIMAIMRQLRSATVFLIFLTSLIFIFNILPWTRWIPQTIIQQAADFSKVIWDAFVALMPSILALFLIAFITIYTLKILRFLSEGIKSGKIKISGLHRELVDPTYQLLRFFVVAFALVAAYPYIPGSDSPVFKGLSIFIGFLLSLGSTSLVSNIIAGIVLTYTRGLRIGDRVKIGDAVGDVVERNLLVTRIRTIKNVVITIPNGKVLNNDIINYSSNVPEQGLILNTTVTIGYDVPWRLVHQLLIDAALATPSILKEPKPFVLQTSLDDYYVSYELNAFTKDPAWMAKTYSALHQNIQDKFKQGQVEIMSPSYAAFRNGNQSTIPDTYSMDYLERIFRPLSEEDTRPRPYMGKSI